MKSIETVFVSHLSTLSKTFIIADSSRLLTLLWFIGSYRDVNILDQNWNMRAYRRPLPCEQLRLPLGPRESSSDGPYQPLPDPSCLLDEASEKIRKDPILACDAYFQYFSLASAASFASLVMVSEAHKGMNYTPFTPR